jgi:hypothetical protein
MTMTARANCSATHHAIDPPRAADSPPVAHYNGATWAAEAGPFIAERIEGAVVEKFYSVAAELAGGETRVLPVRGQTPGEAFQQAKTNPGVRRVGKVTEITPGAYEALQRGETPRPVKPVVSHTSPEQHPDGGLARLNAPLAGPRVVLHARPVGGEQPFRRLQAPPERLGPPRPPKPVVAPTRPQAAIASASVQPTAPARQPSFYAQPGTPAVPSNSPQPTGDRAFTTPNPADSQPEYRIVKSRRQGGDPYLLQRGHWQEGAGKRTFTVEWEKGFPTRPEAERHQEWLRQHAQDLADLRRQAG